MSNLDKKKSHELFFMCKLLINVYQISLHYNPLASVTRHFEKNMHFKKKSKRVNKYFTKSTRFEKNALISSILTHGKIFDTFKYDREIIITL